VREADYGKMKRKQKMEGECIGNVLPDIRNGHGGDAKRVGNRDEM
jgi:hypothetical protein